MYKSILLTNKQKSILFPGSKSVIQRLLTMISYSHTSVKLKNYSRAEDIKTFENTMKKLGYTFTHNDSNVIINYNGQISENIELYIKNSASAYRFLLTRLANYPRLLTKIKVSDQLALRPTDLLYQAINNMKGDVTPHKDSVKITGTRLNGGIVDISPDVSSQYLSSILLSAPYFSEDTEVMLHPKQVSMKYIDLTISLMEENGIAVDKSDDKIKIRCSQEYKFPKEIFIPGDMSSACYFGALGALSQTGIEIKDIDFDQADTGFFSILKKMGAEVNLISKYASVRKNELHGINADMSTMPDQVLTLAILALFADSPTVISGINHLRYKETDRIKAMIDNFTKIGVLYALKDNSIVIHPLKMNPLPVVIDTYEDHRVVMSFSILKSVFPFLRLSETESVKKSFPDFFDKLEELDFHVKQC